MNKTLEFFAGGQGRGLRKFFSRATKTTENDGRGANRNINPPVRTSAEHRHWAKWHRDTEPIRSGSMQSGRDDQIKHDTPGCAWLHMIL